jgi:hypothetical protein
MTCTWKKQSPFAKQFMETPLVEVKDLSAATAVGQNDAKQNNARVSRHKSNAIPSVIASSLV